MNIVIKEVTKEKLVDYVQIPMLKVVNSKLVLKKENQGLGGILLEEIPVKPHIIDLGKEEKPLKWDQLFDISKWGFFIGYDGEQPIAGLTLAYQSPNVRMLDQRNDLTVVWDLRVHPDYKGLGIGKQLIEKATLWAKERNCTQLKIETQNNNVSACHFYAKCGCELGIINQYAYYGDYDDEVMLIWYKNI